MIHESSDRMEDRFNLAFWYNLVLLIVQGLIVYLCCALLSYSNQTIYIIYTIFGTYFLKQLYIVPEAIAEKRMMYGMISMRDIISDLLSSILSIFMALDGYGLWSLIVPYLIIEPLKLVYTYIITYWFPSTKIDYTNLNSIIKYSFSIMGSSFINLIYNDGDKLAIGKMMGDSALGYYSLAWQLSNVVNKNLTSLVSRVSMPVLSNAKSNPKIFQELFNDITQIISVLIIPLYTILFIFSQDIINIVYGNRWTSIDTLFKIFLMYTSIRSLTTISGVIYNVIGKPEKAFVIQLSLLPIYIIAIILGLYNESLGLFALVVVVTKSISALVFFIKSLKHVGIGYSSFIRAMIKTSFINLPLALIGFLLHSYINNLESYVAFLKIILFVLLVSVFFVSSKKNKIFKKVLAGDL